MNHKIDALTNDRSDRQLEMLQRWQDSIQQTQQNLKRTNDVSELSDADLQRKIRNGEIECPTCKERQYVDGSDDPGVSFKTPTGGISPAQSLGAVLQHENEHVTRNRAKADAEGREVTHSSVSVQYSTCPTCGARYVAGGLTRTTTRSKESGENPFEKGMFNVKV